MEASHTRLTPKLISNALKVGRKRWLIDKEGIRNVGRLVARICNQSAAKFYFKYYIKKKPKFIPIGYHDEEEKKSGFLSLANARKIAAEMSIQYRSTLGLSLATTPIIPTASPSAATSITQEPSARIPSPANGKTLLQLAELYVEEQRKRGQVSWKDNEGIVRLHLAPHPLASRVASLLTDEDIAMLLGTVFAKTERTAGKLQALLSAAYNRAKTCPVDPATRGEWRKFAIKSNPVADTEKIGQAGEGDRNLTGPEVGLLWCHLSESDQSDTPKYRFLKLNILLGGQRCAQLARCLLSSVDIYEKTLVISETKGKSDQPKRKHFLPLSDAAWAVTEAQINFAASMGSTHLFPSRTDPEGHINPNTISKITSEISRELTAMNLERPFEKFSYRDIRRTTESRMSDLEVTDESLAQVLSHGINNGVQAKHYNRSKRLRTKRNSLAIWETYLYRMAEEQRPAYLHAKNNLKPADQ